MTLTDKTVNATINSFKVAQLVGLIEVIISMFEVVQE